MIPTVGRCRKGLGGEGWSQSLLHQVNDSYGAPSVPDNPPPKGGSQSLLHQVNDSYSVRASPATATTRFGRNPFFIRSMIPTPTPAGGRNHWQKMAKKTPPRGGPPPRREAFLKNRRFLNHIATLRVHATFLSHLRISMSYQENKGKMDNRCHFFCLFAERPRLFAQAPYFHGLRVTFISTGN